MQPVTGRYRQRRQNTTTPVYSCKPVAGLTIPVSGVLIYLYCRCPAAGGRHKSKPQHACTNHACYFFIERLCDLFLHSCDGMYMLCLDTQVSGCAQSCHKNFTFGQIPCHIISLFESPSFALITEPALSDFRQYHPLPRPNLTSFSHPTRSVPPFRSSARLSESELETARSPAAGTPGGTLGGGAFA